MMKLFICVYFFGYFNFFVKSTNTTEFDKSIMKNGSYLFLDKSTEIYLASTVESEEYATSDSYETWSTTTFRTTTPFYGKSGQSCKDYYEYCERNTTTYRFATVLKGRKVQRMTPQGMNNVQLAKSRCYCDSQCYFYGDCCYDLLAINDTTGEPNKITEEINVRWECHRLPVNTPKPVDVLMIASCPANYDDVNVIVRCLRHNLSSSQYHYSVDVPLISRDTNITYVNIYCAICNNDTNLHKWDFKIHCPFQVPNCTLKLPHWIYQNGQQRWIIRENETLYNITYDLKLKIFEKATYYQAFGLRKCRTEVIRNCPLNWPNGTQQTLCSSYSLILMSGKTNATYKNVHCALCHEENLGNLKCPLISFKNNVGHVPIKTHSYAILMDFYGDGSRVGEKRACGSASILRCKVGEICDLLSHECRVYSCGRKYHMNLAGKCILMETSTTLDDFGDDYNSTDGVTDLPVLNKDCPKVFIHRPNYIDLPNNSIYINTSGLRYSSSEHEYVNQTTVLICATSGLAYFGKFSKVQSILSVIGISISLICLAIHIFIHLFVPQLRNLHGKNLLSLSCSLFISQSFFEFGLNLSQWFPLCVIIGMTVHFGYLASFFWMNVMAIDVCRTFASKANRPSSKDVWKEYGKYSLYAWLMPFIVIILAFTNDQFAYVPQIQPLYGQPLCWINNRNALLIFFAGPLALMLLENVVFFLLTIRGIYKVAKVTKFARHNSSASGQGLSNDRTRMLLYAKLALIMGLTWIFSFVAALGDLEIMWYLFIIFNSLQGAFIFMAFSCKRKVFRLLQASFRQMCRRQQTAANSKSDISKTQSSSGKCITFSTTQPSTNGTHVKDTST